ncbi:MAG: Nmad3 domain-containing protein [Lachnoclostridium sp.]|jgi:hypothetical protein
MRILFCNIAWMEYYKGIIPGTDRPRGGGSYVKKTGDAVEKYNFKPIYLNEDNGYPEGEYCLGYVETKSANKKAGNQLSIEKIDGCELFKNENEVKDVLVVYCALYPDALEKETYVVGWYKHATVYRYYKELPINCGVEGKPYVQLYNAIAKKEDCVLLPRPARRKASLWRVPRKAGGVSYGFGQSNVWFAQGADENEYLKNFLERIARQVEEYYGENWVELDVKSL